MAARRVPAGFRILIGVAIFALTFLLVRPSDPATQSQIEFWKTFAGLFEEPDVEGFVGISLLVICTVMVAITYPLIVRFIEKRMNK